MMMTADTHTLLDAAARPAVTQGLPCAGVAGARGAWGPLLPRGLAVGTAAGARRRLPLALPLLSSPCRTAALVQDTAHT